MAIFANHSWETSQNLRRNLRSPSQKTFNAMIEGSSREKARAFLVGNGMRLEDPGRTLVDLGELKQVSMV